MSTTIIDRQAEFMKSAYNAYSGNCVSCFKFITTTITGDWRCGACYIEDRRPALDYDARVPRAQKHGEPPQPPSVTSTWKAENGQVRYAGNPFDHAASELQLMQQSCELALLAIKLSNKVLVSKETLGSNMADVELADRLVNLADTAHRLADKIAAVRKS